MAAYLWKKADHCTELWADGTHIATVPAMADCTDTFEPIGDGAWCWIRKTAAPVKEMQMTVCRTAPVTYWQVPGVNYNGNGWGSGAQYTGFGCDGTPWTYAWHRTAIPACTYAETGEWAVSLFGEETGGMSCSIWEEEGCLRQQLLWPEQEGPKVLSKRFWMSPFMGTMEPCDTFTGIIFATNVQRKGRGYQKLQDFVWSYFKRPVTMEKSPETLITLETAFSRQLYLEKQNGIVGLSQALMWNENMNQYGKNERFEIGWVGQNASRCCFMLRRYMETGEEDLRDKAIRVLDSWMKYAFLPCGLMLVLLDAPPDRLQGVNNGNIPVDLDACNLGTAATYLLKAYHLAEKAGVHRPEYREKALGLCDFAVKTMKPTGQLAKSWFLDGSVDNPNGSVAAFYVLPLFEAWEETGEEKYLEAALRSFKFYNDQFQENGFTTAGALDSYCIDKESAAPLLRGALKAYHATGDKKYIGYAQDVAYYLNTWFWYHSIDFPKDSVLKKLDYDSFGATSVSAAHNALDPYGLYYVPEYLELSELTGNEMWKEMARALWYNGTQLISDGTLTIEGRVRPAGGQDESCRHTRWGRPDYRFNVTSWNLCSWMGAFRMVALDMIKDWDILR